MTATDPLRLLNEHRAVLEGLESLAANWATRHHDDEAAALCQLAGHYASRNHPGVFTSPVIEETLDTIGQRSSGTRLRAIPRDTRIDRVLHVMTTTYPLGGHTRLVQRWVELDSSRSHSLALTAAGASMTDSLLGTVREGRGEIYRLGDVHRTLLGRARVLRDLAESFDAVVVHAHPFDVVPSLAFAGNTAVPVALLNHADHVFWIGVRAVDRVLNLRSPGADLNVRRRGVAPAANSILPIPLAGVERQMDRTEAKRFLGLSAEDVLVVTMASLYKYAAIDGKGFLEIVAPALLEHHRCVLIAIGPAAQGRWSELESATQGRLRAVGELTDPSLYLDAADLYADSFPFSSLTSLLEAGARGTPLLAYTPPRPGAEVMGPADPALRDRLVSAASPTELARLCSLLAASPDRRSEIGETQRQAIEAFHTGAGWLRHCETIYRELLAGPRQPTGAAARSADHDHAGLLDELLVQLRTRTPLSSLASQQCRHLGRERFPVVGAQARTRPRPSASSTQQPLSVSDRVLADVLRANAGSGGTRPHSPRRGSGDVRRLFSTVLHRVVFGRRGHFTKRRVKVFTALRHPLRALHP